jgi:hypothetical protein
MYLLQINPGIELEFKSRLKAALSCAGGELNPHALRHMALNHACLPIPAPALNFRYYNHLQLNVKRR